MASVRIQSTHLIDIDSCEGNRGIELNRQRLSEPPTLKLGRGHGRTIPASWSLGRGDKLDT